ncbi:Negative regulator of differentiation 1 [Smittium mucronatum]|uniref:Negative regulator of differentiation 1 n=1 Tax=Smittium mucronatum TaxID=133383 RepID=A0A1R0H8J3_9FUNG|nr:Negative regulator of differentiation 1 [Smittium mucronatum]
MKRSFEFNRDIDSAKRQRSGIGTQHALQGHQNTFFRNSRNSGDYQRQNASYHVGDESANGVSRTLYFGNLPEDFEISKLVDQISEGAIESIKVVEQKRCAFVTFIKARSAQILHSKLSSGSKKISLPSKGPSSSSINEVVPVKVGWGKPVVMSRDISTAIEERNATRAVYIGNVELLEPVTNQSTSKDKDSEQSESHKIETESINHETIKPSTPKTYSPDKENNESTITDPSILKLPETVPISPPQSLQCKNESSSNLVKMAMDNIENPQNKDEAPENNILNKTSPNCEVNPPTHTEDKDDSINKALIDEGITGGNNNAKKADISVEESDSNFALGGHNDILEDSMKYYDENGESDSEYNDSRPISGFHDDIKFLSDDDHDFSKDNVELDLDIDIHGKINSDGESVEVMNEIPVYEDLKLDFSDKDGLFTMDLNPEPVDTIIDNPGDKESEKSLDTLTSSVGKKDQSTDRPIKKVTMSDLKSLMSEYGDVEFVRANASKVCIFVYFMKISSAINCVSTLSYKPGWGSPVRVNYARDRCAKDDKNAPRNFGSSLNGYNTQLNRSNQAPNGYYNNDFYPQNYSYRDDDYFSKSAPNSIPFSDDRGLRPGTANINENFRGKGKGNRCVYIGGVSSDTTVEEMCNFIRGGILQLIKLVINKRACFVTFIYSQDAEKFISLVKSNSINLRNRQVKLGWGSSSGSLPQKIKMCVEKKNATRSINVSNLPGKASTESLMSDFGVFGEIESINLLQGRNIGYIHFTDIMSAINLMESVENRSKTQNNPPEKKSVLEYESDSSEEKVLNPNLENIQKESEAKKESVGEFEDFHTKYSSCKFRYGKDRCAHIVKQQVKLFSGFESGNGAFPGNTGNQDFSDQSNMRYPQNYGMDSQNMVRVPPSNQGFGYSYGPQINQGGNNFNQRIGRERIPPVNGANSNIMFMNTQPQFPQMMMGMDPAGNVIQQDGYNGGYPVFNNTGVISGGRNIQYGLGNQRPAGFGTTNSRNNQNNGYNQSNRNFNRQTNGHEVQNISPGGGNSTYPRGNPMNAGEGSGYGGYRQPNIRSNISQPQYQNVNIQSAGYYDHNGFDPMTGVMVNQGGIAGNMVRPQQQIQIGGLGQPRPAYTPSVHSNGYYQQPQIMSGYGNPYPGDHMVNASTIGRPFYNSGRGAYNQSSISGRPSNFRGRSGGNGRGSH